MQVSEELINEMEQFLIANPQWAWVIGAAMYTLTIGAITLIIISIINLIKYLHKPNKRNGMRL